MRSPDNGHPPGDDEPSGVDAPDDSEPLPESGAVSRWLRQGRVRLLASVLSGLLLFACFPNLNWNLLVWVACLPLIAAVVSEPRLGRAFALGYLAGAIFLGGSCYWFVIVMRGYGGLGPIAAVGVLAGFVALFGSFFGSFGLVEAWTARKSRGLALVLSPFLWVGLELGRTYLFTGVPWNLLGYAVQSSGLRQLASVTAVYGLSFLAVATSALMVSALLAPRTAWSISFPAVWFVLLVATNWMYRPPMPPPETRDAYLLQPNVPLDKSVMVKWAPWRDPLPLWRLVEASVEAACPASPLYPAPFSGALPDCSPPRIQSASPRPLIVWAENPAPFYFTADPLVQSAARTIAGHTGAYFIFNTVTFAGPNNTLPHNSAIVLDPAGREVLQYDKIHLVPFGEYVPAWAFPGRIGKIVSEVSDFVPGTSNRAAQTPDGAITVFICYEDIFPQLVRRLTPLGPGVLVNISNDAWYGDSSAAFQHLEMARLRAIENGRYLLRATNDGITTVVDPYGRLLQQLPRHRQMVLPGRFNYVGGQTFYNAHGDVFAWLCVAVTLGIVGLRIREGGRRA